jgi:hypothetical protein
MGAFAELVQRAGGSVPKSPPCFPPIMVFLFTRGLYLQVTEVFTTATLTDAARHWIVTNHDQ